MWYFNLNLPCPTCKLEIKPLGTQKTPVGPYPTAYPSHCPYCRAGIVWEAEKKDEGDDSQLNLFRN
jgi:endogenous inhibitor of DNA gyrase (YacG/DUF329 family)